jgi:hypothetical protein
VEAQNGAQEVLWSQIRITLMTSRIRIRIEVKSWTWIRIKVRQIRNPALGHDPASVALKM